MAKTSQAELVNRVLKGQLWRTLETWQAEGDSLFTMCVRLRVEHDIAVSPATLNRWLRARKALAEQTDERG